MAGQEKAQAGTGKKNISQLKDKILNNDGFFFTLIRSSVSSQLCGWLDTLTAFLVFALFDLTPFLSTAIGAFIGGVANFIINYKYTFHAFGVDWRAAITKFIFVWAGSLLLNSFGTQYVYHWVMDWSWLREITGMTQDGIFLAARLFVALMVSLCWNFLLQRNFVFKATRLDKYINLALDKVGIKAHKLSKPDKFTSHN